MCKITVIIPAIRAGCIYQAIDSVLSQTYKHLELIVVCDMPGKLYAGDIRNYLKENSEKRINNTENSETYKEQLFSWLVIEHMRNMGTVQSLNEAIQASSGKYIYNLADDDVFADERVLEDWTAYFETTGALWSTAKRAIFDNDLNNCIDIRPDDKEVQDIINKQPDELYELLCGENFIFGSCTARSRTCYEKYGLYNEKYHMIEDHSKNLSLLRQGVKLFFFDRVVVNCRNNGVSSVDHVGKCYFRDSNRIFFFEVFPYSKRRLKAIINYIRWRKHIFQDQHFRKG